MSGFWSLLHRTRFVLALLVILAAFFSLPSALKLSVDPSNNAVFVHNQAFSDQIEFEKTFGAGENIAVGLESRDVLTRENIEWIAALTAFFQSRTEIQSVRSLTALKGLKRNLFHLNSEPIAGKFLSGKATSAELKEELDKVREVSSPLLSHAGDFALTAAELAGYLSSDERHDVIEKTRQWISRNPPPSGKAWLSGSAVEQDTFVGFIQSDNKRIVPLTIFMMIFMMIVSQMSFTAFIYPLVVLSATFIFTQALMVWTGHAMNVVTNLVLPVILIVSISDPIHYSSFNFHGESEKADGLYLKRMFRALGLPCFMTSLTTAAGFLSLMTVSVPAIQMFGLYSAAGTGIAYFAAVLLAPFFISLKTPVREAALRDHRPHPFAAFWITLIGKIRFLLPVLSVVLILLGARGVFQVRAETDILNSFFEKDPFRQATLKIQQKTGGVYTLEGLIQAPDDQAYFKRENLERVRRLKKEVSAIDGVMAVRDVTDLIAMVDRAVRGKKAEELPPDFYLKKYLEGLDQDPSPELLSIKTPHFRDTRMTAELSFSSADKTFEAAQKMQAAAARLLPEGWKFSLAGKTYLLAEMSRGLVRNQIKSAAVSFGAIAIMMIVSLWSVRLGFLSAYVNLLPLALLGLAMARFNIPLNTATATVASVAAGLIIDNAIHVLFRYRDCVRAGVRHPVEEMLAHCAVPLTVSTLTLCAGFSVTLLGNVKPTVYFGMLMITVLFLALGANLLFLPAFLSNAVRKVKHG